MEVFKVNDMIYEEFKFMSNQRQNMHDFRINIQGDEQV